MMANISVGKDWARGGEVTGTKVWKWESEKAYSSCWLVGVVDLLKNSLSGVVDDCQKL